MAPIYLPLALAGCLDYALVARSDGGGKLDLGVDFVTDTGVDLAGPYVDASFSVTYQRTSFGSDPTVCWLQVAFYEVGGDDGAGEGGEGQVVDLPDEPGECAYTAFEDGAVADGVMQIRGTVDAGRALGLLGADRVLTLERALDDEGNPSYALPDCAAGVFPFGETFDVFSPGSARADGLEGFMLPGAVAVGPDLERIEPTDAALSGGDLWHDNDTPLVFAWEYLHPAPETSAGPVIPSPLLLLRNTWRSENRTFEALACRPEPDGRLEVPVETLALLTPDDGTDTTYIGAQLDVTWEGPAVTAPWGQVVKVRSLVTFGGVMHLVD